MALHSILDGLRVRKAPGALYTGNQEPFLVLGRGGRGEGREAGAWQDHLQHCGHTCKAVYPTRSVLPGELIAKIICKVVAIRCKEVVLVALVLLAQCDNNFLNLLQVCRSRALRRTEVMEQR